MPAGCAFHGLAAGADYVCLPERPVDVKDMAAKVKAAFAARKTALVVASEAVDIPGGDAQKKEPDEFCHEVLKDLVFAERLTAALEKETGLEVRSAVIGHIQRGGAPTLFDRILGTRAGVKAAELALEGEFGTMVALRGNEVLPVSLKEATAELKTVDARWLKLLDQLTAVQGKTPVAA